MYVAEMSSNVDRGKNVATYELLLATGTCFAAAFFEGDPNRQFIVTELSFVQLHGSVTRAGRRRHG